METASAVLIHIRITIFIGVATVAMLITAIIKVHYCL